MTESSLIDRIVRGVLAQLDPTPPVARAHSSTNSPSAETPVISAAVHVSPEALPGRILPPPVATFPAARSNGPAVTNSPQVTIPAAVPLAASRPAIVPSGDAVLLDDKVITANLLRERIGTSKRVAFTPKAIVTPAARDWLKEKGVHWDRAAAGGTAGSSPSNSAWSIIVSTSTDDVASLQKQAGTNSLASHWELSGTATEAARLAANRVATSASPAVVVLSSQPERVACLANRTRGVRAVVVTSAKDWLAVRPTCGPNVVVVSPVGRRFMELKSLLEHVCSSGAPVSPADWSESP